MLRPSAFVAGLFAVVIAGAHPAVSVVHDSRGNIFYSDTTRVWRVTPAGEHTVFVPRVHTHELAVDSADRLLGEHLWYDSAQAEPWHHYLWAASPDGRFEKLTADTAGFRRNHGFALDHLGRAYWAERSAELGATILRRETDGRLTPIAHNSALRNVRWLTCSPDGTVYLINDTDLVRVSADGHTRVIARQLAGPATSDPNHRVMGLCADNHGIVHAAVAELGVVKRIAADGQIRVVARSAPPWHPCGVLATADGVLWILEYNPENAMRLRRLRPDGTETYFGP